MKYPTIHRSGAACLLALLLLLLAPCAAAQAPLSLFDRETKVRAISFKFVDQQTFEEDRLMEQIALEEPGFFSRVKRILPFFSADYPPFSPVVLQKDVARLRNFYNRNGYLHPEIGYAASQLDTTNNTIHVIFSVEEGPPLILQDVGFFAPGGGFAFYQFPEGAQEDWIEFREAVTVRTGDRYSIADRIRIVEEVAAWLKNRGYAFARVDAEADIDPEANTADLAFFVDPGPRGYFSEILVEGNETVPRSVILRELPFSEGDRFSFDKLLQGQRELFALNLFRVALTEVIEDQPRDSTVTVRVRVREAQPRYVTAQTGYGRDQGSTVQGEWTHRNLFGGAQTFTASAVANTGLLAVPSGNLPTSRLLRGAVSLRQPYLFTTKLSAIVSPFFQFERDPLLLETDEFLGVNAREFGLNTTLIYEFYPFRTISLQHTFVRALQLAGTRQLPGVSRTRDLFNKSVLSLSGIFGNVDDYVVPTQGFLLRPFVETGGTFLGSAIEYTKVGTEVTGYFPLERINLYAPITDMVGLAGRVFVGRIWPYGRSREALLGSVSPEDSLRFENRFDPVLFYIGGTDLRGWSNQLAGDQVPRPIIRYRQQDGQTVADTAGHAYEALGGLAELGMNVEVRLPFPGLGSDWGSAVFLDAGQVSNRIFDLSDMRYGAGAGIRYRSLIGIIRLDLAFKLNPSYFDLREPGEVYEYLFEGGDEPGAQWYRYFNIHLSIGQAF